MVEGVADVGDVIAITCERRGNFAPIIRLAAPAQLQLSTIGIDYQALRSGKASVELALSRRDGNRFSEIGNFQMAE